METVCLSLAIFAGLSGVIYGVVGMISPDVVFYWFHWGWKYENLEPTPQDLWEARAGALSNAAALGLGALVFFILRPGWLPDNALALAGLAMLLFWVVGDQIAAVIRPERYFYWKDSRWKEARELRPSPLHLFVIRARAGLFLTCMAGAIFYFALQLDSEKSAVVPATHEHEEVAL
jgi:hypothetical protein